MAQIIKAAVLVSGMSRTPICWLISARGFDSDCLDSERPDNFKHFLA